MKQIKFGELHIGPQARENLNTVCDTDWASSGPMVKELEDRWGKLFGYRNNIAVSSGTDACINACLSLYDKGAKRGDKIIVPALSFIATSNAVRMAGFAPVFVDVLKETLNIDETKIEQVITDDVVAIMPVHTMGRMCEMDAICKIAKTYNLTVIEDACEAHGARFKSKYVGQWGDISVYSFYVAHLICSGEGGMISTDDEEIAKVLSSTKSHGRPFKSIYFDHIRTGINSKMNDLEASLGLEGVDEFWDTFWTRHRFRQIIRDGCIGLEHKAWFSEENIDRVNCPHGFSITCKNPGKLSKLTYSLDQYKIQHKRNFGSIPTQHKAFQDMCYTLGDFPNAEYIGDNGVHIGCHKYLTKENLDRIITAIRKGLE